MALGTAAAGAAAGTGAAGAAKTAAEGSITPDAAAAVAGVPRESAEGRCAWKDKVGEIVACVSAFPATLEALASAFRRLDDIPVSLNLEFTSLGAGEASLAPIFLVRAARTSESEKARGLAMGESDLGCCVRCRNSGVPGEELICVTMGAPFGKGNSHCLRSAGVSSPRQ